MCAKHFLYGVLDSIKFVYDILGSLGGLLVVKKALIGVGFEVREAESRGPPC